MQEINDARSIQNMQDRTETREQISKMFSVIDGINRKICKTSDAWSLECDRIKYLVDKI